MKRSISILLICICWVLVSSQGFAQTKIIKGGSPYGDVLYNFDGIFLRSGANQYSTVLFNWDGEAVRRGSNKYSEVLYNFDGEYVRPGDSKYSEKLLTIFGKLPVGVLIFLLM